MMGSKIVTYDGSAYSSYSEGREAVRFTVAGCEFISHPDVDTRFDGDFGCRPDFFIQGTIVDYKGLVYQENYPRLIDLSRKIGGYFVATGDIPFNCYTIEEYIASIQKTWKEEGQCGYRTYNAWIKGENCGLVFPIFRRTGLVKYLLDTAGNIDETCKYLRENFSEEDLDFTLELSRYASGFKNFDSEEDWAEDGTLEYKEQMNRIHTDTPHHRNERLALHSSEIRNENESEFEVEVEVKPEFEPEFEVDPDEYVEIESDPTLDPDFASGLNSEIEPEWVGWIAEIGVKSGKNHGRGNVITPTVGNRLYEKVEHDHDKFVETTTLLMESKIPSDKRFKRVYVEEVGSVVCVHFGKYDRLRMIAKISSLREEDIDKDNYGKVLCDRYDYHKKQDRLSDNLNQIREQRFSEVAQDLSQRTGVPVGNVAAILGDSIALGYVSLNLA